ncbi:hypothetical protein TWF506_001230 [Arthrobotrys conoides]|uniref:Tat pathway signal sequence protein n=1 Tax=Arthrobotrys conoides TaxID=74498 RepID=A0AAN8RXQ7_9PEZI
MNIFTTHGFPKYNSLPSVPETDTDSEKTLLNTSKEEIISCTDTESIIYDNEEPPFRKRWGFLTASACITFLNITLLIGSSFCYYQAFHSKKPLPGYTTSLNEELKEFSYFSPLLDVIDVPTKVEQMNGSLFPGPNPSIFRLPPSPEVDEAWESVSRVAMFTITTQDVIKMGKDPSQTVRLPESFGFPPDTHLAQFDSVHQIHCLNTLRKAVFFEYYHGKKSTINRLYWVHLSHCAGIILQNLMCQANLDVITLNWVNTQTNPFPDFSVNKKCRDYGVIKKWQDENKLDDEILKRMVRPKSYVEIAAPLQNIMDAFEEAKTPWDFDWTTM